MSEEIESSSESVPTAPATMPRWPVPAAASVAVAGVCFYLWVLATRPAKAEFWGQMGNTIAPFAAALSAFALFAVLYSLRLQLSALDEQRKALELQRTELKLQRKELALQRQEFKDSREVLKEQKEQFERTAEAQEALAKSQAAGTDAQVRANHLTLQTMRFNLGAQVGQRANNRAVLAAAVATMTATIATSRRDLVATPGATRSLENEVAQLRGMIDEETRNIAGIHEVLAADSELGNA